jgi:hypothetical protein
MTALADEIANYSIYRLKNKIAQIGEMSRVEQEDTRNVIRDAALYVLNESATSSREV